ncbi:MAG: FecR family protein [Bauldia sp.]
MFLKLRTALLVLAGLCLLAVPAAGQSWQVTQASGQVWFATQGALSVALTRASVVPDGATVVTGANGRAVLARGAESMVLGPNSAVALPAPQDGRTTVMQRAGEVTFEVDRQSVPHFAVETPHLAAVVKGTQFTVKVAELDATVAVERGEVEVTDLFTGEVVDITAGQNANVEGTFSRLTVGGTGALPERRPGSPRSAVVAALAISDIAAMQLPQGTGVRPGAPRSPVTDTSRTTTVLGGPTNAPAYLAQAPNAPSPGPARTQTSQAFERILGDTNNTPAPTSGRTLAIGPGRDAGAATAGDAEGDERSANTEGTGPGAALANGFNQLARASSRAAGAVPSYLTDRTATDEINVSPHMIAMIIAAAALLALAIAFLRARFG